MGNDLILIVEDDAVVIKGLETHFRSHGFNVVTAASTAEGLRATVTKKPDLMILDLTLVDGSSLNGLRDGLGMLGWLRYTLPEATFPVIIHTADQSPNLEERVKPLGVHAVFRKGQSIRHLMTAVRQALDERAA